MITDEMVEAGCRGMVRHLSDVHGETIEWPGLHREYERYRIREQVKCILEEVEKLK